MQLCLERSMAASSSSYVARRYEVSLLNRLLPAALFATFLFSSPLCAQRGASNGRSAGVAEINVQVRNPNGTAAPRGIHVRLESEEGGAADDCVTEVGGKCRFQPNSAGMYLVRLNQIGYKEVSVHVNLVDSLRGYVTLDLKPDQPEASPDIPDGVSGDSISATELGVPENARQEFEKGQSAMKENKLDAGISHLRKAVKLYDTYPMAYTLLGTAYMEQKNWMGAEAALQKSIGLDSNSADAYLALGAVFNQTRNYPQAETTLLRGLALKPDASTGHYELAKTYWALGRWREAAPHARKAVSGMPDVASPHVLLGNVLLRENNPQGALTEYQEYLRLDPNGVMAPGVRQMIEKIKKSPRP
jgi:tetratricopeptide (TPR) repeat protein